MKPDIFRIDNHEDFYSTARIGVIVANCFLLAERRPSESRVWLIDFSRNGRRLEIDRGLLRTDLELEGALGDYALHWRW